MVNTGTGLRTLARVMSRAARANRRRAAHTLATAAHHAGSAHDRSAVRVGLHSARLDPLGG